MASFWVYSTPLAHTPAALDRRAACRENASTAVRSVGCKRSRGVLGCKGTRDVRVRCEGKKQKSTTVLSEALKGGDVDEVYVKGGEYLRSLGMTNQAEIARVLDIAMNPNSLFVSFRDSKRAHNSNARRLSVESDMKPLVEFLKSYDMTNEDVVRVITMHPPILCYDIKQRIQPLVTYLKSVGLTNPIKSLVHRPSLFGLEVDGSLEKIVGFLKENEYSEEAIINLLENSI